MQLPRLREWRESRGLTQKELAEEARASEFTVARAEGGAAVRPNTARRLAEVMGVAVADLMESPPVPLGEAPPGGNLAGVPSTLDELLERRGAPTRHLADEGLIRTLKRETPEAGARIVEELDVEVEAIIPDLLRLGKLRDDQDAMRIYAVATRQIAIAHMWLSAHRDTPEPTPPAVPQTLDRLREKYEAILVGGPA
jgi:transcriptional regulator with XRE-family HTH domain